MIEAAARPAMAKAFVEVCIRVVESVALRAMRFPGIAGGWGVPSQGIHLLRDGLEMIGVNTPAIPAKVVNNETSRHGTLKGFVGPSMGRNLAACRVYSTANPERAIAISAVQVTEPLPAAINTLMAECQKALQGLLRFSSARHNLHQPFYQV